MLTLVALAQGSSPDEELFRTAREGSAEEVTFLLSTGANVKARDEYGQTPLMYAAAENSGEVLKVLLEAGADINARSGAGWTPLMYAARDNSIEVVLALAEWDADPSAGVFESYFNARFGYSL